MTFVPDEFASVPDDVVGVTVGVIGQSWRVSVSPSGSVVPWGSAIGTPAPSLEWFVAADDRWHVPSEEPTVRQRRLDGAPVVETRLRVPDGDVVQRVWAVPDRGGLTVVEFENESPLPLAVAVTGHEVLTGRAPSSVEPQGIELSGDPIVLPIGHRATARVAIAHGSGRRTGVADLAGLPPARAVARGWTAVTDRASRFLVPDEALAEAVVSARSDLLLAGPVDPDRDPAGHLLDVGELVRLGDDAQTWLPFVVGPAERLARRSRRGRSPVDDDALASVERIALAAGDDRAVADVVRLRSRRGRRLPGPRGAEPVAGGVVGLSEVQRGASVGRFVRAVERCLVAEATLLPAGVPTSWLGSNFEVHGLPTSACSSVSFALRWHGDRPAVLWEQQGPPVALCAPVLDPAWSSGEVSGEALWPAPRRVAGPVIPVGATGASTDAASDGARPPTSFR